MHEKRLFLAKIHFNMTLRIFLILMLSVGQLSVAQDVYTSASIPGALTENADAVVRLDRTEIIISGRRTMKIRKHRIVTVLNEKGIDDANAGAYLDKSTDVNNIEALIYNASGQQIKKIKRKDFREVSVSEGSEVSDGKSLYLDYTPIQYPFTIDFTSEITTSNTAFIPMWAPVDDLYASVEKSEVVISVSADLGFRYKDYNFGQGIELEKKEEGNTLLLSASNIPALKNEEYSPSFHKMLPHAIFGLEKFHLEGVDGEAIDWQNFGGWMYENLLEGTDELPVETQDKIKNLVGNEQDPLKKARIVYEYMQSKTRYISIQLGIGGWKPMRAKDVDRLGYGDCKALTNYTRALLKAVGVDSYYAVVYAGPEKRDLLADFVSMQGNHVILAIPIGDDITWLECTNQAAPFGFQGKFTDDRMALLVKPGKGELVRTHVYTTDQNTQVCKGVYTISDSGSIVGSVMITSRGTQYDNKYFLESSSPDDLDKFYKSAFGSVNNLKLKKMEVKNDRQGKEFSEEIALEAESYCNKSGNRMMFAVNAFNQYNNIPQRYRSRQNPFEIKRGFCDTDEITINLPAGFSVEAKPENVTISDKFGEYKAEYVMVSPAQMLYKRSLTVKDGSYPGAEYENYRLFREKIARNDGAKIVLVKN